jgi:hypothetical protein
MTGHLDYAYIAAIIGLVTLLLVLIFWIWYRIDIIEKYLEALTRSLENPNKTINATKQDESPKNKKK